MGWNKGGNLHFVGKPCWLFQNGWKPLFPHCPEWLGSFCFCCLVFGVFFFPLSSFFPSFLEYLRETPWGCSCLCGRLLRPDLVAFSTCSPVWFPVNFGFFLSPSCAVVWAGKPSWLQYDANETGVKDFFPVQAVQPVHIIGGGITYLGDVCCIDISQTY